MCIRDRAKTSLIWVILLSLLAGLLGGVLLSQVHARRHRFGTDHSYSSDASSETPSSIDDEVS